MHYLEATFRTAIRNKGFKEPLNVQFVSQKENQKVFLVCRDGYNLAKDFFNLGLTGITRYKDHERFFVCVEFCDEPIV